MPLGYEECDLHVYIDYKQERQNNRGPYIFCTDGTQVDSGSLEDCIIEPATLSILGKPLPMTDEWRTVYAGNYARYDFTDYIFTNSVKWKRQAVQNAGDWYIVSNSELTNDQQDIIELDRTQERNDPIFFSFSKLQKKSSSKQPLLKLMWSNEINRDKDVQLHFMQDGGCDVYRGYVKLPGTIIAQTASSTVTGVFTQFTDIVFGLLPGNILLDVYGRELGEVASVTNDLQIILTANSAYDFVGEYSTLTPNKVASYNRTESNYSQGRPITTVINPNDQFNDVYVIPSRGRDLMVLTSFGLNFSHTFSDLGSGDIFPDAPLNITGYEAANPTTVPIILPDGKFKIQILAGKIMFQTAKLYFKSQWSALSQIITPSTTPPDAPDFDLFAGGITFSLFDTDPTLVTGGSTFFTTEVNVSDMLVAKVPGTKFGGMILGIVDTITSNTVLNLSDPVIYQGFGNEFTAYPRMNGTISISTGDNIVNGVGTNFTTELNLEDRIYLSDGTYIGQVDAIISNTQLTLFSKTSNNAGAALFYKNINDYSTNYLDNIQSELFGVTEVISANTKITFSIVNAAGSETNVFDGVNNGFRIRIEGEDTTSSRDYGFMFYSYDQTLSLLNEYTSNTEVDIVCTLESLSLQRNETGEYSLSMDARTKLLEDLGIVKPDILSNRPIKVTMQPRRLILTGLVSKGASDQLTGVDTLFTEELIVDQEIYLENGLFVGLVYSIASDTALTLYGYTAEEFAAEPYSPYKLFSEFLVFEGYLDSPDITYLQSGPLPDTYEEYALLSFTAIDKKQRLNAQYFNVAPNYDSKRLQNIISGVIQLAGAGQNDVNNTATLGYNRISQTPVLDVSPTIFAFDVPINRNNSNGQFNFAINLGDSAGGFIEKIRSDYAQNFVFFARCDWSPRTNSQNGYNNYTEFKLLDYNYVTSNNSALYNVNLYLSETLALDNGLIPVYASYKRTVRNLKRTFEKPEANRILITGLDKSDGSRIEYVMNDYNSQSVGLLPVDRPDNWLGDIYPFVMVNDKLNTKSDVIQTAEQFFNKLTPGRDIVEFESDFLTYYDGLTHFVPNGPALLSGEIQFFDNSDVVVGTLTEFTTELEIGDILYDNSGTIIGRVYSITDDFELILNANATYDSGISIPFNNYTIYLKEYNYIDIGDIIYISDQNNVETAYQILDWSCDFVRQIETPTLYAPNVRFAKYRAKKVTVPNNDELILSNTNYSPAANQKIITHDNLLEFICEIVNFNPEATYTATLNNEPAGMTASIVDGIILKYANVQWTPNAGQADEIYNNIELEISDGTNTSAYVFSVRVY
jgi:hypothetical protein